MPTLKTQSSQHTCPQSLEELKCVPVSYTFHSMTLEKIPKIRCTFTASESQQRTFLLFLSMYPILSNADSGKMATYQ